MRKLQCAVCGTDVPEKTAARQEYKEEQSLEKYYFCCDEHRMEFIKDPNSYTGQSGRHVA